MSFAPSIVQCVCRMNELHARILRGERPDGASPLWVCRGFDVAAKTMRRWGAMEGREVTDRGREILAAYDAKHTRRCDQ